MKINLKNIVFMVGLWALGFGLWASSVGASTYGDRPFYRDINAIYVYVSVQKQRDTRIVPVIDNVFGQIITLPLNGQVVEGWVSEALKEKIDVPKEIKLETTDAPYLTGNIAEQLLFNVYVNYWTAGLFSPKLNHDVISIDIRERRKVRRNMGFGKMKESIETKYSQPYLISVPKNKKELEKNIREVLTIFFKMRIKQINCANGNGEACLELNKE